MIKIEFPADNLAAARHLGAALTALGNATQAAGEAVKEFGKVAEKTAEHIEEEIDDGAVVAHKTANVDNTTANTDTRLDNHGVAFDPAMCGEAAVPFYASGPNAGQWKKKKGVDQATYDAWYVGVKPTATADDTADTVNTATAFAPDTGNNTNTDPDIPHDAGTLMAWVSGMQGAGRLTQDQVNEAYKQSDLTMPDIFPSDVNTPDIIRDRVASIYGFLSAWA